MQARTRGPMMADIVRRQWLMLLLWFGALSLAAVGLGVFISAASGVPAALWSRNLLAWALGALVAVTIAMIMRSRALPAILWLAPAGLAASVLGPGVQGVHRWIDLGPAHMNVAMLLLPSALVALAVLVWGRVWPWIAVLASLALLAMQPDASQATTLAVVAALVAGSSLRRFTLRFAVAAAAGLLAALAWRAPDPLLPVPEVEGIIDLAFSLSPLAGVAAWLLLLLVAATPALATISAPPALRVAGWALSGCFLLWALVPRLGAFPVPFVGIGPSPILGGWLAVAVLAGLLRRVGDGALR